jgi:hypothetical protein
MSEAVMIAMTSATWITSFAGLHGRIPSHSYSVSYSDDLREGPHGMFVLVGATGFEPVTSRL